MAAPAESGLSHGATTVVRVNPHINPTTADLDQLKSNVPDKSLPENPKAYLNFDNRLNFVSDGSGVNQVKGGPVQLKTLASGQVVAKKDGYVYVYTSNESQQDVFFDNMSVIQITGPVLEEIHYYPFGLTMAGISDQAMLKLENRFKFSGIELNHKEFSDGSGLEWYDYVHRSYDPQIGRFIQIDGLASIFPWQSSYISMDDNPILKTDPTGMAASHIYDLGGNFLGQMIKDYKEKQL